MWGGLNYRHLVIRRITEVLCTFRVQFLTLAAYQHRDSIDLMPDRAQPAIAECMAQTRDRPQTARAIACPQLKTTTMPGARRDRSKYCAVDQQTRWRSIKQIVAARAIPRLPRARFRATPRVRAPMLTLAAGSW